jgi:hypothetical protein
MELTVVRIKATGQIVGLIPSVAEAMLRGGTAEEVKPVQPETAMLQPEPEKAVTRQEDPRPRRRRA